jgi:mRNA interferase MazF
MMAGVRVAEAAPWPLGSQAPKRGIHDAELLVASTEKGLRNRLRSGNRSRLRTILAVVLTSNLRLLDAPGNVLWPSKVTGLPKDSTAVVTQVVTLDQDYLSECVGKIPPRLMAQVDGGLKPALDL